MSELTTLQQKDVDAMHRALQDIAAIVAKIPRRDLAILVHRAPMTTAPDGHATNKRPKFGRGGSNDDTPTESAMLQLIGEAGRRVSDPQGHAISIVFELLPLMLKASQTIDKEIRFVVTTGDKERGREDSLSYCECCGGPVTNTERDRIISGLGPTCHGSYMAARRKAAKHQMQIDRQLWMIERLAKINAGEKARCGEVLDNKTTAA